MKKWIAFLLALLMLFSLAACSNNADSDDSDDSSDTSDVSEDKEKDEEDDKDKEKDEEDKEDETKDEEDTSSDEETQTPVDDDAQDETTAKPANELAFEELTVVDNDQCTIKLTSVDPDDDWGFTIKAELENKSADKTYMYTVSNAAVNGVQCSPMFASDVAAGKKANEDITFMDSDLEDNGITEYTDIELTFRVYDSEDWSADDVAMETVHVYPYGEDKATTFVREAQPEDNVILDNEYATVIITGYEPDGDWGYTVNAYCVNKTDSEIMVTLEDVSVNGYMADPFFATSIAGGKSSFETIWWTESSFEDNSITDVEEIEFTLRVYDAQDWSADDYANEPVVLNP